MNRGGFGLPKRRRLPTAGVYGDATHIPQVTVDADGGVSAIGSVVAAGGAGGVWLGPWSGATAYVADDIVEKDGSSYICILGHTNQAPPNATYWFLVAEKGDTGAGVPNGGTTGQVLTKQSATDQDTDWETPSGGGGGSVFPFVPPGSPNAMDDEFAGSSLDAKWTWVNQGGASALVGSGVLQLIAPSSASDNHRIIVQAVPSAPYTIEAAFTPAYKLGNFTHAGILLYNSANGRFETLGVVNGTAWRYDRFTNVTTFSATPFTPTAGYYAPGVVLYVRLAVTSTTITVQISVNGRTWVDVGTSTISTFLSAITGVGFNVNSNNSHEVSLVGRYFRRVA